MHRGFGGFSGSEKLVLHNMVCGQCNQIFGDTIDLALTRDSAEGLERYRWGIRDPSEIDSFRGRAVVQRVGEGDFKGAELTAFYDKEHSRIAQRLEPIVAVRNVDDEGYTFFSADKAASGAILDDPQVDWKRGIRVMGTGESVDALRDALERQEIMPNQWTALESPPEGSPLDVEVEFRITVSCRRAVAKIAFNYLAARAGSAFVLDTQFDTIRRFIRYGEEPDQPLVIADPSHSFDLRYNDGGRIVSDKGKIPVVHVVTLETHTAHQNIISCVTLFSFVTYRVVLAVDFDGIWPPLPIGHVFNVAERLTSEIGSRPAGWGI